MGSKLNDETYDDAKILFLDVDGVLNSMEYRRSERYRDSPDFAEEMSAAKLIDPRALAILDGVLLHTGALVVLSSMWRTFPGMPALMQRMLDARGAKHVRIVDRTPDRPDLDGEYATFASPLGRERIVPRGYEICQWLRKHPEIRSFAIVDDDDDMVSIHPERTQKFAQCFVQTEFEHGLRDADGARLIEILSRA